MLLLLLLLLLFVAAVVIREPKSFCGFVVVCVAFVIVAVMV